MPSVIMGSMAEVPAPCAADLGREDARNVALAVLVLFFSGAPLAKP